MATLGAALLAGAALGTPTSKVRTLIQAPLALVGFFYGLGAWLIGGSIAWLIAALFIGVVLPLTFFTAKTTKLRALRAPSSVIATGLMLYALATGVEPGVPLMAASSMRNEVPLSATALDIRSSGSKSRSVERRIPAR